MPNGITNNSSQHVNLNPPVTVSDIKVTASSTGVNINDIDDNYIADVLNGTKSLETASFDLANALDKSIDIAKLMFILQSLFRESQSVEANCVISAMEANVQSLLTQADIIIDNAEKAKEQADSAAKLKMVAGALTIAAGVFSLATLGGMKYAGTSTEAATSAAQGVSSGFSGSGQVTSAASEFDSNEAEETRQTSTAQQKEADAVAQEAQVDKQRAEMWESHFNQLVQELMQIAKALLEEVTNSLRAVGRNI